MIKVALLCGGPSPERGISLNSARSVLDHLTNDDIEIIAIYFDHHKKAYHISNSQLYSNTPSDFDFKLHDTAKPLNESALVKLLKHADLAFPAMHGQFGEDGGIQKLLERHHIPFVGSNAKACQKIFNKFTVNQTIDAQGFFTLPSMMLNYRQSNNIQQIRSFFKRHQIQRAIVKPASGGSSIGVFSVSNPEQALEKAHYLFTTKIDKNVVIEPFANGKEFTVIILQNRFQLPVALIPTEIETNYDQHQIFDFRKKYLPTHNVHYHCPPRFSDETIEKIRVQAEQLFALFGLNDFARFDGWVFPDGNIWFSDFNPISGMEQNSFLFMQASRVGLSHSEVLRHIVSHACQRYQIDFDWQADTSQSNKRKPVHVLFGGHNSERQVSLMSGTNVWLKLRKSKQYQPIPFLLDSNNQVWKVPYQLALNHTVEEIIENCQHYDQDEKRLRAFNQQSRHRLGIFTAEDNSMFFHPEKMSLSRFIEQSPFVFIALHGGDGENGHLQKKLSAQHVKFNGPDENITRLCMNKWLTGREIDALAIRGISAVPGQRFSSRALFAYSNDALSKRWQMLCQKFASDSLIIKPCSDGCSSGVMRLNSAADLQKYLRFIKAALPFIPANTLSQQSSIVEMPTTKVSAFLIEKFIETDKLSIHRHLIKHQQHTGYLEMTIGVIEQKGKVRALNPSITIASGDVLTVEEKFQGGTGINITPPPQNIISQKILQKIKRNITHLANQLGMHAYSRIDAFINIKTGDMMIIEINALPALTPSTVLYHQALAEKRPMTPRRLLEQLIVNKHY